MPASRAGQALPKPVLGRPNDNVSLGSSGIGTENEPFTHYGKARSRENDCVCLGSPRIKAALFMSLPLFEVVIHRPSPGGFPLVQLSVCSVSSKRGRQSCLCRAVFLTDRQP